MKNFYVKNFITSIVQILLIVCMLISFASAQQVVNMEIQGVVKNELNENLGAVSITNLMSKQVVTTEDAGVFKILAHRGDSLRFSHIGYEDNVIVINNTINLTVVLTALNNSLNEVVVVGYGQQRKINMVGSQSTVKVEDLKQPVANLSASLAGRIAGLVGVQRTGLPGSNSADVWIRGISTFNSQNSASPLIVVDGVQGRDLNAFDPEDIAS